MSRLLSRISKTNIPQIVTTLVNNEISKDHYAAVSNEVS